MPGQPSFQLTFNFNYIQSFPLSTFSHNSMLKMSTVYLSILLLTLILTFATSLTKDISEQSAEVANSNDLNTTWTSDPTLNETFEDIGCDFSRIHIARGTDGSQSSSSWDIDYPLVLSGLMDDWPARDVWTKSAFLEMYGNRSIRTGSESSIVYSGGVAESFVTLGDLVHRMSLVSSDNDSSLLETSFVFDTTILRAIPELASDYSVPKLFAHWDNVDIERANQVWHMLSLGPSRSGLPFHHHGRTWLAVVHGAKRWFVYPPGYGPPPEIDALSNPFLSSSRWVDDIYPLLQSYPKPPLYSYQLQNEQHPHDLNLTTGYRPLECVQRPGEVMFIPDRWAHMTINLGETVAIGGQELLRDDVRMDGAHKALELNPFNYEALKDIGLTESNHATYTTLDRRKHLTTYREDLILLTSRQDLLEKMRLTRDSWLVLYYHNSTYSDYAPDEHGVQTSAEQDAQLDMMCEVANELHGVLNVAAMDLTLQQISQYENLPLLVNTQTGQNHYALPFLKLHRGEENADDSTEDFHIDEAGVLCPPEDMEEAQRVVEFALEVLEEENMMHGSMLTVSVDVMDQYDRGIHMLRAALDARPSHPETTNLLCEVIAETGDLEAVEQCVQRAVQVYQRLSVPGASPTALASVYYRLARIYMTRDMFLEALPLLTLSLSHRPSHQDALIDRVSVLVRSGDKVEAEGALNVLKGQIGDNKSIPRIEELEREVADMK